MRLKASRTLLKINDIVELLLELMIMGLASLMTFWIILPCSKKAMFQNALNLLSLNASRTISKINDIDGVVA